MKQSGGYRHLLTLISTIAAVLWPFAASAANAKLRVGFIAALSGPVQAYGEAAKNGFDFALSEINDGSITVKYEDDQFIPAKTIAAFRKLIDVDGIDVAVCVGSNCCNAIAPLAQARGIPLIGWASDVKVSKNRQDVIRSFPSGEAEGIATGKEAVRRNFSKIAVVSSIHDYTLSWRRGLLSVLRPDSVVLDEQVLPSMQDFKSVLLRARQQGVESFIICLLPGQDGLLARQAGELHVAAKFGGCMMLEDQNEAKLANGALTGAWYVTIPIEPSFAAAYEKRFGNTNTLSGAAVHYDLAQLLSRLIKNGKATEIAKNLMSIGTIEGKAGTMTAKTEDGDQFFDYAFVVRQIPPAHPNVADSAM